MVLSANYNRCIIEQANGPRKEFLQYGHFLKTGQLLYRVWILPYRSSASCYMRMRTRQGCSLGPHVLPFLECTTIKDRVADKNFLNHMLLIILQLIGSYYYRHKPFLEKKFRVLNPLTPRSWYSSIFLSNKYMYQWHRFLCKDAIVTTFYKSSCYMLEDLTSKVDHHANTCFLWEGNYHKRILYNHL